MPVVGKNHEYKVIIDKLWEKLFVKAKLTAVRDSDDDWVLATALCGRANALVTGDKDLLVRGSVADIPILSPASVLDCCGGHSDRVCFMR